MIIEPQLPRIKALREDGVKGFRPGVIYGAFPRLPCY